MMTSADKEQSKCELCGEPMPAGDEMFKYHGYSGSYQKLPKQKENLLIDIWKKCKDVIISVTSGGKMKRKFWCLLYLAMMVISIFCLRWVFGWDLKLVAMVASVTLFVISFSSLIVPAPWED